MTSIACVLFVVHIYMCVSVWIHYFYVQVDMMHHRGRVSSASNSSLETTTTDTAAGMSKDGGVLGATTGIFSGDDILIVQFELFMAPLLQPGEGSNLLFDVATLIPPNPVFDVVAVQRLQIQNNSLSNFHEYFPVIILYSILCVKYVSY